MCNLKHIIIRHIYYSNVDGIIVKSTLRELSNAVLPSAKYR